MILTEKKGYTFGEGGTWFHVVDQVQNEDEVTVAYENGTAVRGKIGIDGEHIRVGNVVCLPKSPANKPSGSGLKHVVFWQLAPRKRDWEDALVIRHIGHFGSEVLGSTERGRWASLTHELAYAPSSTKDLRQAQDCGSKIEILVDKDGNPVAPKVTVSRSDLIDVVYRNLPEQHRFRERISTREGIERVLAKAGVEVVE